MVNRYRKQDAAGMESCSGCGMLLGGPREYHPHAACELFRACGNSQEVQANLAAVIEYGMRAQSAGVDLDQAIHDFATVQRASARHGQANNRPRRCRRQAIVGEVR